MHGSRLTTLTEGSCGKGDTSALIDLTQLVINATVFIIVSGKLTAASVNAKDAIQIGKACMEAYANKLPQGLYNKISSYVVIMDTPMKGMNAGAVTTVDIEFVFNRTFGIIGFKKSLICKILFSHKLAPIPTSFFLYDGSMISASSTKKLNLKLRSHLAQAKIDSS